MDPVFDESAYNTQNATPAPQYPSAASHTLNVPTNMAPHFADQSHVSGFQDVGAQSAGGYAPTGGPTSAYGGAPGTQTQDTSSIQNYSASHHTGTPSTHDAYAVSSQDQSAYPYAHNNAYPAQPAPVQSAQGIHIQTEANAGGNVDVQALLDSLTPAAHNAPSGHYASQMPLQSAQPQGSASASLPQPASNLPPRPPAQEKPATHPNYDPTDDIRSYHPGSQMPSNTQQRGNGQSQGSQQSSMATQSGGQSSAASGMGQQQGGRSETPDDEDIRWGPEVNRLYEAFLDQERKFVTEGQWDQFPMGSRLFIGKHKQRLLLTKFANKRQATFRLRRSQNATSTIDSIDTASSRRSRSSKRTASSNSSIPNHADEHWTRSKDKQCVVGKCVSKPGSL